MKTVIPVPADFIAIDASEVAESVFNSSPKEFARIWQLQTGVDLSDQPDVLLRRAKAFAERYGYEGFMRNLAYKMNPKELNSEIVEKARLSLNNSLIQADAKKTEVLKKLVQNNEQKG